MLNFLRNLIPDRHPIRLFYHLVMAVLAAILYGFPAKKMIVVGVTGTNGKTTTVNLIADVLVNAGKKVGMTSTVNFRVGDKKWVNTMKQSTLGPFKLNKLLSDMVKAGCEYVVLEVTSHAITQHRIFGINFNVAVMTNITSDHLEYHGGFSNYVNTKGLLFKKIVQAPKKGVKGTIILNSDDQYYDFYSQYNADVKMSYGLIRRSEVYVSDIKLSPTHTDFILHISNSSVPVRLAMPGRYNVYNALAVSCAGLALGFSLAEIADGLKKCDAVPGRYDPVYAGQKFNVVVDYAHAPEALDSLLKFYKDTVTGKVFLVFGATGGGRDKAKRPDMGAIADKYADYIVVTNDDPYMEDQVEIINQISQGINRTEGDNFWKIIDRRVAIELAISMAREGDCVIVAGKGAEEVIVIGDKKIPWNDKKVIKDILSRMV